VQIGKITRFGLLEMSRQRLRPSIGESAYQSCPRCSGFGTIRSTESLALAILRIIGEEARKERTAKVIAQLPVEVATYLLNEKRNWVQSLETNNDVQVILVANSALETPHYDIRRVRDDQAELPENAGVSYALAEKDPLAEPPQYAKDSKPVEQAAIAVIPPSTPPPVRTEPPSGGFWTWLKGLFGSDEDEESTKKKRTSTRTRSTEAGKRPGRNQQRTRGERQGGQERNRQRQKKQPAKKKRGDSAGAEPRKAKPQDVTTAKSAPERQAPQSSASTENRDDQKRSSRSRRSRGGRRRRKNAEQRGQAGEPGEQRRAEDGGARTTDQSAEHQRVADKSNGQGGNGVLVPSVPAPSVVSAPADTGAGQSAPAPGGPPRVRTDAERTADAEKAKSAEQPVKKPETRLLPWEPAVPPAGHETAASPKSTPETQDPV
jgi:ribonuclease E